MQHETIFIHVFQVETCSALFHPPPSLSSSLSPYLSPSPFLSLSVSGGSGSSAVIFNQHLGGRHRDSPVLCQGSQRRHTWNNCLRYPNSPVALQIKKKNERKGVWLTYIAVDVWIIHDVTIWLFISRCVIWELNAYIHNCAYFLISRTHRRGRGEMLLSCLTFH